MISGYGGIEAGNLKGMVGQCAIYSAPWRKEKEYGYWGPVGSLWWVECSVCGRGGQEGMKLARVAGASS